ncbi:apolipoprotein d [Plakobranchus ocellatus]|uniref:Apolipoprotein d n=1 Tax=Plakobranchus ocellatus TaxID=259542 RepID=A0AAV4AXZ2_9GAST|nr:apolipoprotein d [Plakobranchus ocellatus]
MRRLMIPFLQPFHFTAGRSKKPNYSIVSTDYRTYAVVFSCTPIPGRNLNMHGAWILTRVRGVPPSNLNRLEAALKNSKVSVSSFTVSGQSNCPDDITSSSASSVSSASSASAAMVNGGRRLARRQMI